MKYRYMLRLKVVNIYPLNLKLTNIWDEEMQLLLCYLIVLETKVETWGTTFDKCNQITAHADDAVIMGRRLQDGEEVFTSLIEKTNKVKLEINFKITKFMIVA